MADRYRIFGAELSPYSVKVRSYFRYKGIAHQWIIRNADSQAEYQKYARLPIVPLVVTPQNEGLQDSTPIIERMESVHPQPAIHPSDPVAAFVSVLLEEFGDEWGNKWMFHYRWARDVDQLSSAGRIARMLMPAADDEQLSAAIAQVRERMAGRVWFVGSNPQTAPQIEDSFCETLAMLQTHLANRAYLFGARPAFGDFAMWGQIYNAWTDPTPGAIIEARATNVLAWIHRMLWPRAEGNFEDWPSLEPTLMPLLERQAGRLFMPWTTANAGAIADGREEFSVELAGRTWTQKPQKYHAKSLGALRAKYAALPDKRAIDAVLDRAGCLAGLRG
ncbi:glutathione S-transferase family protein [Candidatus Binatus sp.]|uniref:glutathione S-transferase family protein n=1 Tax=Candidatus Binatus sp. TaxID=2811406 RepID=UPI002F93E267